MPRTCTVCTHPKRTEIDAAIVRGDSQSSIAESFGLSKAAVDRHSEAHLPQSLLKAQEAREELASIDVMAELTKCIERVNLLSDACDRWLRDPDDPTRYDVSPRAHDVKVIYEVEESIPNSDRTRTIRKKAHLSELIERFESNSGHDVTSVEVKHADPRELLLRAFQQQQNRLELVAKLIGQLDERPVVNVTLSPQWLQVRAVIVQTLAPYPEARRQVAEALAQIEGPQ